MEGLRALTDANSAAAHNVNDAIFDIAVQLLRSDGFVIFEEVIIRAKQRQNRNLIQWDVQRDALKSYFGGRVLVSLSRATLREMIDSKTDPLHVLKDVAEHLHRKGRGIGNLTAGFAFAERHRSITERQIEARRHVAKGIDKSADHVENALRNPQPLLAEKEG